MNQVAAGTKFTGSFLVEDNVLIANAGSAEEERFDLRDLAQLSQAQLLLAPIGLVLGEDGQIVPKDAVEKFAAVVKTAPLKPPVIIARTSQVDAELLRAASDALEGLDSVIKAMSEAGQSATSGSAQTEKNPVNYSSETQQANAPGGGAAGLSSTASATADELVALALKLSLEFDGQNQDALEAVLDVLKKAGEAEAAKAEQLAAACDLHNTANRFCGQFMVQNKLQKMGYSPQQARSIAKALKDMKGPAGFLLAMDAVQSAPNNASSSDATKNAARGQDDLLAFLVDGGEKDDDNALIELLLRCMMESALAKMADGKAVLDKHSGGNRVCC